MSRPQERPHPSVHCACVCTKGRLSPCNEILETGVRRSSSVRRLKRGCACGPVIWRPGLGHTLEMLYCGIRPRTFGECRSPRVLFEGTCDVALTCWKQRASALTTRKPLRRPIHPVMNDDSQRPSPTKVVFTCQACKGISQMQRISTLAPARSRSSRLPLIAEMCIARALESEVRRQSGDAQRLCQNDRDCTGDRSLGRSCGRRSEDPQHQTRQCVPCWFAGRVFPPQGSKLQ